MVNVSALGGSQSGNQYWFSNHWTDNTTTSTKIRCDDMNILFQPYISSKT